MTRICCDRCKKDIPDPVTRRQASIPVKFIDNASWPAHVDLCRLCAEELVRVTKEFLDGTGR
jgi:hypothetical protein